jgi:hypothetical protein
MNSIRTKLSALAEIKRDEIKAQYMKINYYLGSITWREDRKSGRSG